MASYLERAREVADDLPEFQPRFDYEVGWSENFTQLLEGDWTGTSGIESLIDQAFHHGRVVLHADAGAGKTVVAHRLFRIAVANDIPAVWVVPGGWNPDTQASWDAVPTQSEQAWRILLTGLGQPSSPETLALPHLLVIVDGLNEVAHRTGNEILDSLDALARHRPRVGVVVTDRKVRRPVEQGTWRFATLLPLRDEAIDSLAPPHRLADVPRALLRKPFILDRVLREGASPASQAELLSSYFEEAVGLDYRALEQLSAAALAAYVEEGRTFSRRSLEVRTSQEVVQALEAAGAVTAREDHLSFAHHLYHDYLAARYVARDPARWNHEHFDAITLDASSAEPLALAAEQLSASLVDRFVRRVYDWNLYAAAHVLGLASQGRSEISESLEVAVLAMIAERRWDTILSTAQRVDDALRVHPSPTSTRFLDAGSLEEVFAIVESFETADSWFDTWRRLFTTRPEERVSDQDVARLAREGSLIGWTMANVLKRVSATEEQLGEVRDWTRHEDLVIRWRAVHVLGAKPGDRNRDVLLVALDDSEKWVRYGAVRSLVELAALTPHRESRTRIFGLLLERLEGAGSDRVVEREFARAVIVRRPPDGWQEDVAPVIDHLWGTSRSIEEQDFWRDIAQQVSVLTTAEPSRVA